MTPDHSEITQAPKVMKKDVLQEIEKGIQAKSPPLHPPRSDQA